jgi:hypothetical protein
MVAANHWSDAWRPMFERDDHVALILPITICSATDEVGTQLKRIALSDNHRAGTV